MILPSAMGNANLNMRAMPDGTSFLGKISSGLTGSVNPRGKDLSDAIKEYYHFAGTRHSSYRLSQSSARPIKERMGCKYSPTGKPYSPDRFAAWENILAYSTSMFSNVCSKFPHGILKPVPG